MILVTGGAGFIGRHVVRLLIEAGESVRVFDLSDRQRGQLLTHRSEYMEGDIRNPGQIRAALQDCDRVIHLAANPNLWTRRRKDFDEVNHRGAVNVFEASLAAGVKKIVHASTESILVSHRRTNIGIERADLDPNDIIGPYCMSKFLGERAALELGRQGAPVIVVNPTLPVGPGDWGVSPPTRMTVQFCRGKLPGYVDCRFNMIDVRDVAAGIVSALERGQPGRRYLLGFRNLRLIEWLTMVGREIGKRPPTIRVPYPVALGFAWLSECYADLFSGQIPSATITGVKLTRFSMHFDPAESLSALGISPRPLEESVRDAVIWYREIGWLSQTE